MKPLERVFVCTDFSKQGDHAVSVAFRVVAGHPATVVLAHVIEDIPVPNPLYAHFTPAAHWDPESQKRANAAAQQHLLRLVPQGARERGITVEVQVYTGGVVERILDAAKEHNADLIVVGTHGRGVLPRLLLGSVAERVVRMADRPVLVVH